MTTRNRILQANGDAVIFYYKQLRISSGKACFNYLSKERKLAQRTMDEYKLGFAPNNWHSLKSYMLKLGYTEQELLDAGLITRSKKDPAKTYDFFINRAMFPFVDLAGYVVGFGGRALSDNDKRKYVNSRDTIAYNKRHFLFGGYYAKKSILPWIDDSVILCEGNLDVISLHQAGFTQSLATCGTALTTEQANLIKGFADTVVVCYDSDEAGQKATLKAISILEEAGLKTKVAHMEGAKDPDEFIKRFGANEFYGVIKNSIPGMKYRCQQCQQKDKASFISSLVGNIKKLDTAEKREDYIMYLRSWLS